MSLINDALKKVSEAERGKQAPPVDFEMRAMQPAIYEKRPQPLLWCSIACLAVAIGVATFMFARQRPIPIAPKLTMAVAKSQPAESKAAPTPAPVEKAKAKPVEAAPVAAAPTNTISPAATPAPAASAAPTPAQPAPAPVAAPAGPTFRLKGILYTKDPTALINEASVHVGGEVDGATVTKIEATRVVLDFAGKTITLKLAVK